MGKMMRKILAAVTVVSVMSAVCACAPKEEGSNAPQVISGGTAATVAIKEGKATAPEQAATSDTYGLTYKGVFLTPGMNEAEAIKALGEGYVLRVADSCAFQGEERTYDYGKIAIYASSHDDTDKVNTIEVRDASVDCGGVKLGCTLEDVKKVYGNPTSEESYGLLYQKNHTQIQFICAEGKEVTSILFTTY